MTAPLSPERLAELRDMSRNLPRPPSTGNAQTFAPYRLAKAVPELLDEVERLQALVREVAACGADDIDPRIKYVEVQVDRETWADLQAEISEPPAAPEAGPEPAPLPPAEPKVVDLMAALEQSVKDARAARKAKGGES